MVMVRSFKSILIPRNLAFLPDSRPVYRSGMAGGAKAYATMNAGFAYSYWHPVFHGPRSRAFEHAKLCSSRGRRNDAIYRMY